MARNMYNSYMQKLSTLQNNLWSNGYTAQTRRDLSAARAGYYSDITRLGTAIKTRQQRSAEYWKTKHDHPDMIMGSDPGKNSLDAYLSDDLTGQDYYSYSGNQFMAEVGTEAAARAKEMLRDPRIASDPRLKGYLTRITQDGFTNQEVNEAYRAVLAALGDDPRSVYDLDTAAFRGLTDPSRILAETLVSNLKATGAAGNVDVSEFGRLLEYGRRGLANAVGKTEMKDLEDKEYAFQQQLRLYDEKLKRDLALAQAKAAASGKKSSSGSGEEGGSTEHIEDTETVSHTGPGASKKMRRLDNLLDENKSNLLISKSGRTVHNPVEASSLVYSEDLRREAYGVLGFDIGRDPGTGWRNSDNFLRGKVTHNGVEYDVIFNPNDRFEGEKGAVRVKTGEGRELISPELTRYYRMQRKKYEDTLKGYKESDPEIYKMATIDPDRQYDMYEDEGVSYDVPLGQFRSAVMRQPENTTRNVEYVSVAERGVDSGDYIERMGKILADRLERDGDDFRRTRHRVREATQNSTDYIHPMTEYGTVGDKALKNVPKVFNYDKNTGHITNINQVKLTEDAIMNDYIIFDVNDNNGRKAINSYAVGLDMFGSNALRAIFAEARRDLYNIDNEPALTEEDKKMLKLRVVKNASVYIKDLFGYRKNTRSQSGTSGENEN